ncbi:hypothetical protein BpHYR1_009763 [Brachionus plicatilis]|uniref:Uncharacterized protein n=1 Tax=Brachionus plicatilis TaxID=10195 RepID=A0A3M7T9P9_BRAPC|nr:hypothetical protein BpHYR1_009763 [Brachionus plicatilis]
MNPHQALSVECDSDILLHSLPYINAVFTTVLCSLSFVSLLVSLFACLNKILLNQTEFHFSGLCLGKY